MGQPSQPETGENLHHPRRRKEHNRSRKLNLQAFQNRDPLPEKSRDIPYGIIYNYSAKIPQISDKHSVAKPLSA